jgi:membrane associated rhomboid family serine protease
MRTQLGSAAIFCVIAAVFLLELAKGAAGNDPALLSLGALPDSGQIHNEYWRLLTCGFLHYDFRHLLLNTLLLLLLGPIVERRVGTSWLLSLFLVASVASGAGILAKHQLWPSSGVSLGASGGMFGLLGSALVLSFRQPLPGPFIRIAPLVVLALGITYSFLPGVSMIGHVIGLIIGAAIALVVRLPGPAPEV